MGLTKVTGDFIETGSITQGHLHSSHGITLDHIGDGSTNTFFTTANARAAISATGSLSYNNSTGVMSFTMPTLNTTNITEGNKLFFTDARAISALTAGTNIAIASNGTISSTDTNTTYSVGDGGLTQNNFTNTLKSKLDGIATGATNVTNTNQLTNGAGYLTSLGANSVDSDNYVDGSIDTAHLADSTSSTTGVTYAKMQKVTNMNRILGRISPTDLTVAQLTKSDVLTMLNVADGANNYTFNGTLSGDLTWGNGYKLSNGNNSNNAEVLSATTGAAGIVLKDSGGTFKMQLYGEGGHYGLLASEWGGWDLRKANNGELTIYVNGTGQTAIHTGNYSSYALPLSGGTVSGNVTMSSNYYEFGNGVGSVSNDGSWNARLNVAGSHHARLDVKSVSDGIITTMYSHTGKGVGRVGTMSNHPLVLMVNGSTYGTLRTTGLELNAVVNNTNQGAHYGRNHAYPTPELKGYGAEFMIGAMNTDIHINYRTCNGGTSGHTPLNWFWRAGSGSNWSNHNFGSIYANGGSTFGAALYWVEWLRNHSNNNGIYWSNTGWHLYPESTASFFMRSGSTSEVRLNLTTAGNSRGSVYANSSNDVGFLNNGGSWRLRVTGGDYTEVLGSKLKLNDTSAHIHGGTITSRQGSRFIDVGYSGSCYIEANRTDSASSTILFGAAYNTTGIWSRVGTTNGGASHSSSPRQFTITMGSTVEFTMATNGVMSGDFNDTSDVLFKKNIANHSYGLAAVNTLKPREFNWKRNTRPQGKQVGFIAQEVEEIIPEVVHGYDGAKSINGTGLISVLTKAIQELSQQVTDLKAEVELLKQ